MSDLTVWISWLTERYNAGRSRPTVYLPQTVAVTAQLGCLSELKKIIQPFMSNGLLKICPMNQFNAPISWKVYKLFVLHSAN